MSGRSLYEILEVSPDASPEVIKAAYKSLVAKFHPDRDASSAGSLRFKEVQDAFQVLSDPTKRRQYDSSREVDYPPSSAGNRVILRVDGSSTFLTLDEHQRRNWQESSGCDFTNLVFVGVSFKNAKLAGASLNGSRFVECDFSSADLSRTSAMNSHFENTSFAGTVCVQTAFSGSSLCDATFSNAKLLHACDFSNANLSDSSFDGLDLRRSVFFQSTLVRSRLRRCNLMGVNLASCNLVDADLDSCIVDEASEFPSGYPAPRGLRKTDTARSEVTPPFLATAGRSIAITLALAFFTSMVVAFLGSRDQPTTASLDSQRFLVPTENVVTGGGLTVFSKPAQPRAREPYTIVIDIQLPIELGLYPISDLSGEIHGPDNFRQNLPCDSRAPNAAAYRTVDGNSAPLVSSSLVPLSDGRAQILIRMPGAARSASDTVQIRSKLLNTEHVLSVPYALSQTRP